MTITARLWDTIARHLEHRIGDRAWAEDCLNAAYVRMREYQAGHVVMNEPLFLKRAALNLAVDDRRSARMRLTLPVCVSDLAGIRDPVALPDEAMAMKERLARVRARLMRLDSRTREIFLMHRLDGLKHREIAERLGISKSAVEKHVAKAALAIASMNGR